ncbi:MAG TPA: SRPBCC domain-containing protein [Bauldia sp.]|nr:SRPBCC domain-containing protein [Bauldia sp.]
MPAAGRPLIATTDDVLKIEHLFDAPCDLVFALWSDRAHVLRWWGPRGYRLSHCEMEFRVGGSFRFCMSGPHDHWIRGVYREITPPSRLVFTYINEADGHEMLVTLRFTPRGKQTVMHFHQAPFMNVRERDGHNGGWSDTFEMLDEYIATLGSAP